MKFRQRFMLGGAALLLTGLGSASANVIVSTPATVSTNIVSTATPPSYIFDFPDIANATQLLSIGGGTVHGAEAGNFELELRYADASIQSLFTTEIGFFETFDLNTITNISFAEGTADALIFRAVTAPIAPFAFLELKIPMGTAFEFETASTTGVPEPGSAAVVAAGLAAYWAARQRRRKRT